MLPSRKEKKKIAAEEPKEKVMSSKQKKRLDKFIVKSLENLNLCAAVHAHPTPLSFALLVCMTN